MTYPLFCRERRLILAVPQSMVVAWLLPNLQYRVILDKYAITIPLELVGVYLSKCAVTYWTTFVTPLKVGATPGKNF